MPTKTAFLGTPGWVQDPERFDNADLMKAAGANTGNLVFQYAATHLVAGRVEHVGFSGKGYGDLNVIRGLNYFVFPAANHLRAGADWTLLAKYLVQLRVPLVVLGLGAQAEHGADPKTTAAEVRAHAPTMALVDVLRDKAALITVRGRFSEAVCHELGLKDVIRNGCPSQYINPDRELGQSISKQLAQIRAASKPAPIAITASAPNELAGWRGDVEARLLEWMTMDGGLYIQQSCSHDMFDGLGGRLAVPSTEEFGIVCGLIAGIDPNEAQSGAQPTKGRQVPETREAAAARLYQKRLQALYAGLITRHFRMYFDARRWIEALGTTDIAIGTRIHGNMAALAASRPGVLVLHDARVAELAEEMHVPRIASGDFLPARGLRDVLAAVKFDGAAFDAARIAKSGILAEAFLKIGLPPSAHLLALAGMGNEAAAKAACPGGH